MILEFESLRMFRIDNSMSVDQEFQTRNAKFQESPLTELSAFVESYDGKAEDNLTKRSNSESQRSNVATMVKFELQNQIEIMQCK